jgi:hypothetical protein
LPLPGIEHQPSSLQPVVIETELSVMVICKILKAIIILGLLRKPVAHLHGHQNWLAGHDPQVEDIC